jgi:hypothetical protein
MAKMKKYAIQNNFVQVPNQTAKAVEKEISLQALGLIVNLWSYNVEVWELHKTELYKRYSKNKETSVKTAWNELVEAKYIIEFKYRDGKRWEYEYHYKIEPFTLEEIQNIRLEAVEEYGQIWGLDFQDLKMRSSNCGPQNQEIIKKELKKEKSKKNKSNQDNKSLLTKNDLINLCNSFYTTYSVGRWSKKQWTTLIEKYVTETDWNEVAFPNSFIEGSIKGMARHFDYREGKILDPFDKDGIDYLDSEGKVPFYNWLEE